MKEWIYQRLYLFYSGILLLYIINVFWDNSVLAYIVGLLAIPMLVISFLWATKLFRVLGSAFIIIGFIMYSSAELPITDIPLYLTSNMSMLAFLMILPWINSVVHVGRYDEQINQLMKENVDNLGSLYVRSTVTTYILMTFLNLSAINLAQGVLIENMKGVKKVIRDTFISKTTIRAFALALIWSPMEIIVAITVDATGISYLVYLPWLLLVSVIAVAIDLFLGRKRYEKIPYVQTNKSEKEVSLNEILQQILKLLFALTLFLITILVVSNVFNLNFILTVTLVILPFSSIWAIIIKRWNQFRILGYKIWKEQTNRMQNFVILFLSLAFFSNSLSATPILEIVQGPFLKFEDYPIIILSLILVTYFVMALIGVHPIATIGILLEVLSPLFTVFNPVSIGIVLIVAALATSSSGTYGITVTMTSLNTQQNPYRITLHNLPFTLLFGMIGIVVALFMI
ncbi:hypothetical protein NSQ77_15350 [Oceanobacillus sp. FSL K6-2867]|uniref:hypothetical protein n=1 Tax=Oceanobacillus sp. FSL K6-2867 TaxID=2954748 RepID=UPI0030D8C39D